MNDTDKILKMLEGLNEKVDQQGKALTNIQADVSTVKDGLAHTNTAIKALPTKRDVEAIIDTAIDAAKNELKADILNLDAKVIRKVQSLERRTTNLEEHQGIENPEKH